MPSTPGKNTPKKASGSRTQSKAGQTPAQSATQQEKKNLPQTNSSEQTPKIWGDIVIPPDAEDSGGVDALKPIGKGNPPRKFFFKPGKSGNPKGYPKGQPNSATIIKHWFAQKESVNNPISGKLEKLTQMDIMTLKVMSVVRQSGNPAAFNALLDRMDGKPSQTHKLIMPGKKSLEITVGFKVPDAANTKKEEKP